MGTADHSSLIIHRLGPSSLSSLLILGTIPLKTENRMPGQGTEEQVTVPPPLVLQATCVDQTMNGIRSK